MGQTKRIVNIQDMLDATTEENLQDFVVNLYKTLRYAMKAREVDPEVELIYIDWIDDGKHDVELKIVE